MYTTIFNNSYNYVENIFLRVKYEQTNIRARTHTHIHTHTLTQWQTYILGTLRLEL